MSLIHTCGQARQGRAAGGCIMMLRALYLFLLLFAIFPVTANTLSEDIAEMVSLLRIEEDLQTQHNQCIEGSADITEAEIERGLNAEYSDIDFDAEDLALLVTIYAEFYIYGCSYLTGSELVNFYKAEIRKRFSHAEIIALIDFYKTPLGNKLNTQWLEINNLYGSIFQERQTVDTYEAQRNYEEQMEKFWNHLEKKADEREKDIDA